MHKLTGKQCRQARALLKWNLYDLANHLNGINPRRIESFERGMVHVAEWENDEMVNAFRDQGVLFNADLDVVLDETHQKINPQQRTHGEGAHITLNADQSVVSDSTSNVPSLIAKEGEAGSEPDES